MLRIILVLSTLFSLQAQAAIIQLDSGDQITVQANVATTVSCGGEGSGLVYKYCECTSGSSHSAVLVEKYKDKAEKRSLMKAFYTYDQTECQKFLTTIPQCR